METTNPLELISKLRQRLIRLIRLGEPNQLRLAINPSMDINTASRIPLDLTGSVEDCVRRLFTTVCSVDQFIQDVQQILNVTIKNNLGIFLLQTIPLAQEYLRQLNCDPFSWDAFKMVSFQTSLSLDNSSSTTRLPSLQQARFRLPPSCPQLIDLTTSSKVTESISHMPSIRADANLYQQKLISRFAQRQFYLDEDAEYLILQTLDHFLRYILRRVLFYTNHRTDTKLYHSDRYEMTSHVREQIRFLVDLNKTQHGEASNIEQKNESINDEEQKRNRTREYRSSILEELRRKEADETALLVLRESRSKRPRSAPIRIRRANLQDLLIVMEEEPILKRSKALLYAYANR